MHMPIFLSRARKQAAACLCFAALVSAQEIPKSQPPLWTGKPDVAAFEKIEDGKLAAAQKSIDRLTAVKGPRTIENTLRPYDDAIQLLNSANYFASLMQQVHPEAMYRDRATAMVRKVSAAVTALSLNRQVYNALTAVDLSHADAETRYYIERQSLEFRLAGVDKDDAARAKLKKLNDQLTEEQSAFDRNISDSTKTVTVSTVSELDGLPKDYIDRHPSGKDGLIRITTDYPDYMPAIKFAKSAALRRQLFAAFQTRAFPKNMEVLKSMMQTRYEIASLLGYNSWADYSAADKMIGKGAAIADFIQKIDTAAHPVAEKEFAMLLAQKKRTDSAARNLADYEMPYLEEQVRRQKFNFDSQSLRPYLPYARMKQGVLDTAARLFQISFRQERNVPAWDPSVETWDVIDRGKAIGRFYLDMHPRPGKFSHAEMAPVLDGIRGRQLPEAILVCNLPAPSANDTGLMEYDDVVTFFHEFGHLMHWIIGGQQQWAGISGITMESDFVEAPSQMLEEWMRSPQVLASFGIPADLVTRMNHAYAFARGIWSIRQNAYTAISYDLYKGKPQDIDADATCMRDLTRYSYYAQTPDTHMCASFGHLGGYSSTYYTYLWDKEIAEDFFGQFDRRNLLAGSAPMRYRNQVLEPGGSMSANVLVKNFLGRKQDLTAFERWLGEEFE
jgi:thimet oligopeptidase